VVVMVAMIVPVGMIMVVMMIVAVLVAVRRLGRVVGHDVSSSPENRMHPPFPLRRQNFARNVQKCSKVVQAPSLHAGVGCTVTITLSTLALIACTIIPAKLHEPIMRSGSLDVSRGAKCHVMRRSRHA